MIEEQLRDDFERARRKAFLNDLVALITRRPNNLLPYHEVRKRLTPESENYRGMTSVPLDKIVGSMDRYGDFDREFLPRRNDSSSRWQRIDRAYYEDKPLPPIQVYKMGDVYFVKDGHHRVSVARAKGQEFIDAEVIEGKTHVPLHPGMTPKELLLQLEYSEFLHRTNLDRLRPRHDIRPTQLGRYDEIWEHIQLHQKDLSSELGPRVAIEEAVVDWYDRIYEPVVRLIRARGVLDWFPGHTEADLYLWVMDRRDELALECGHEVNLAEAVEAYADTVPPWRKLIGEVWTAIRRASSGLDNAQRRAKSAAGRLSRVPRLQPPNSRRAGQREPPRM